MICPYCGHIDENIKIPEITKRGDEKILGTCKKCDKKVWAYPTTKKRENSQLETVTRGEKREVVLANIYVNYIDGKDHMEMNPADDIDRKVLDNDGNILCYLEIKERSNTLNAYKKTMFPYAKIKRAKELIDKYGKPVHILLKFRDCWARIVIDKDSKFEKGNLPFAPRYRPWQRRKKRQVPVKIPVEDLEVLDIRDYCEEIQ